MKKSHVLVLLAMIPFALSAQVDSFFRKYQDLEGATLLSFHGNFLQKLLDNEHNKKHPNRANKIADLDILAIDEDRGLINPRDIDRLKAELRRSEWELLMTIRDVPTHVQFLMKEDRNVIRELVMVVEDPKTFTLARFRGEIHLKELGKVCENIEIGGKNYLAQLE